MGKNYYFRWTAFFVLLIAMFTSCQKEMDKYYELPAWLKGNAWELLEKDGNYTIFLQGIEQSGFADMVKGKGIITVMAPNDAAFNAYFAAKGFASIEEMDKSALKELINFHLLYYSFGKTQFANYQPSGSENSTINPDLDRGLYYKFRTKSIQPISIGQTPSGRSLRIYHKDRFLPVLSAELFNTKGIDAKSNYEYFYGGSTWTGGSDGFNVSNASVTEYALATDNGYVYKVSTVLEPLETINDELAKQSDFSMFRSQYNRFAVFSYDEANTKLYSDKTILNDSLWVLTHKGLPSIASEWTNGTMIPDYADLARLSKVANNIFAPSNTAMNTFMNSFWGSEYTSFNEMNVLITRYLLGNHVTPESGMAFPEEIEMGKVKSMFGDIVNFSRNDATFRKMCVNGSFYGINKVMIPPAFKTVTAPLFKYKRFNMALYLTNTATDLMAIMGSQDSENGFKFYIPNDIMLTEHTAIANMAIRYWETDPYVYGNQSVQLEGSEDWGNISAFAALKVMNNHVVTKDMTPGRQLKQGKIYKTLENYGYLLFRNDSIFSSSHINSAYFDNVPSYKELSTESNGTTYELTGDNASALVPDYAHILRDILKDVATCPADYAEFRKLLTSAGVFATTPTFEFLLGNNFVVFIPTNDVILANRSEIPIVPDDATDPTYNAKKAELLAYVKRYFIDRDLSFPLDYPFKGSNVVSQKSIVSYARVAVPGSTSMIQKKFTLLDDGSNLKIQYPISENQSETVNILTLFPRMYPDGAAYLIDGLLEVK